jgi:glucans biosynthesis protein
MSFRLPAVLLLATAVLVAVWLGRNPTLPSSEDEANPAAELPVAADPLDPASADVWTPDPRRLTEALTERARAMARRPYAPPRQTVPLPLRQLDFDGYRQIRFRPGRALWRGEGAFEVQLFHLGSIHETPVDVHLVDGDSVYGLTYDPTLFDFQGDAAQVGELDPRSVPGFAGFRIHYPLNRPDIHDEVAAFQGASYFRVLGAGQEYGLSARGIAVDPAVDGPEEFPDFRAYWIEPPSDDDRLVFHALLDGPSLTGAYRFELSPGPSTELLVDARVFARTDVTKLGVAPFSSMFLHAPGLSPAQDDFRPRVHDSDGLQMLTGRGEWIWRPLSNGPGLHVTSLRTEEPVGFGLFQRTRDFDSFLDLEARYHLRPSYWVEVLGGDWGPGGVELLEIPTDSEFNDNVAAYWVPDVPLRAGEERSYRYRLVTRGPLPPDMPVAHVARTAIGWDALPGQADPPPRSRRRFVVDFEGGSLPSSQMGVEADISVLRGMVEGVMIQHLPGNSGLRVTFTADMRLFLTSQSHVLSETWSYVWYPDRIG